MDFKLNMIQNYCSDDGFGFKLNNMANINAFMINLHLVLAEFLIGSSTRIMGFFNLLLQLRGSLNQLAHNSWASKNDKII